MSGSASFQRARKSYGHFCDSGQEKIIPGGLPIQKSSGNAGSRRQSTSGLPGFDRIIPFNFLEPDFPFLIPEYFLEARFCETKRCMAPDVLWRRRQSQSR
jgi:hypothetical protein